MVGKGLPDHAGGMHSVAEATRAQVVCSYKNALVYGDVLRGLLNWSYEWELTQRRDCKRAQHNKEKHVVSLYLF
jgi:hypothetical protein